MPSTTGSRCWLFLIPIIGSVCLPTWGAATLTGSFSSIPAGTAINLSAAGPLDWVHWGLYTGTSLDRKVGVTPMIGNFSFALSQM